MSSSYISICVPEGTSFADVSEVFRKLRVKLDFNHEFYPSPSLVAPMPLALENIKWPAVPTNLPLPASMTQEIEGFPGKLQTPRSLLDKWAGAFDVDENLPGIKKNAGDVIEERLAALRSKCIVQGISVPLRSSTNSAQVRDTQDEDDGMCHPMDIEDWSN